jgi:VWFA-related protein
MMLALVIVAFIGCSGGGGTTGGGSSGGGSSGGGGGTSTAPEIALSATQIDFGGVVIDNSSDRSITVQNTGTAALTIRQIAQPSAPFRIEEDNCSGVSVSPSGSCTIKVRFSPIDQTSSTGSFNIPSNDSDENPVAVTLRGSGRGLNVSINRFETDACTAIPKKLKLLVTVADKTGAAIAGLQASNFRIFENGPQINTFGLTVPPIQLPISVGLVLDYSSSMIPYTADLQTATLSFLDELNFSNDPKDEAEIIKFDAEIFPVQAYTSDQTLLTNAVNGAFPGAQAGTSLFDAVRRSIDNTLARSNIRLAVVAVSDGNDFNSTSTLDQAIAYGVEKGVPVFTIGIGDVNAEQMQRLANETGGQYFLAPSSSNLEAIYLQIAQVLSDQYLIEYNTSSSGGNTVSVDVEVDYNGLQGAGSRDAVGCP